MSAALCKVIDLYSHHFDTKNFAFTSAEQKSLALYFEAQEKYDVICRAKTGDGKGLVYTLAAKRDFHRSYGKKLVFLPFTSAVLAAKDKCKQCGCQVCFLFTFNMDSGYSLSECKNLVPLRCCRSRLFWIPN